MTTTPVSLSAKDKSSFAYLTIKDRLPVILTKVADTVYRKKTQVKEEQGEKGIDELKFIVGCISKLRNEVQTNKPLVDIKDAHSDVEIWNRYLATVTKEDGQEPKWFQSPWLYVECYMYRRIQEAVWQCSVLHELDVFEEQKRKAFTDSEKAIETLLIYLKSIVEKTEAATESDVDEYLREFIQIALWGNRCDLSISSAQENAQTSCILDQLHHLEANILINDTSQVLQSLRKSTNSPKNVDIILDNAGFELLTDLCLAEFLLSSGLATCVRFHGKAMPWFVSDVTETDFKWTLDSLCKSGCTALSHFGNKWNQRMQNGSWTIAFEDFWTMPFSYAEMKMYASNLYSSFKDAKLTFFKGDLNYRKLLGDRNWDSTTNFEVSLCGFHPSPLCALRACKADLIVGLAPGQKENVQKQDEKWMVNGNWAVISFCDKIIQ